MLVNISDAFPRDTLISRPQILKTRTTSILTQGGQTMAPPVRTARIGNGHEAPRQRTHLFGIEHDLGGSRQLKVMPVGMGELPLRMAAERAHKEPLGGVRVRAIA